MRASYLIYVLDAYISLDFTLLCCNSILYAIAIYNININYMYINKCNITNKIDISGKTFPCLR